MHLRLDLQCFGARLFDQSALVVNGNELLASRLGHLNDLGLLEIIDRIEAALVDSVKCNLLCLAEQISLADIDLRLLNFGSLDNFLAFRWFLAALRCLGVILLVLRNPVVQDFVLTQALGFDDSNF